MCELNMKTKSLLAEAEEESKEIVVRVAETPSWDRIASQKIGCQLEGN
jgi:hypothetical protein